MEVAVVTILGMIGYRDEESKAEYTFGPLLSPHYVLEKRRYTNTLPVLCELFGTERIVPIYTEEAKTVQKKVLEAEGIDSAFLDNPVGKIDDDKDYKAIFSMINDILYEYERVIVDLTHGFRHLPILATIDLIMANIKDPQKIERIFFAKEIEQFKKYQIIDLHEYLDMANISFTLSSFTRSYTVANHIQCIDADYQELIALISNFSEHILANSILVLIEGENSLTDRILERLDHLDAEQVKGLEVYIRDIRLHLLKMRAIGKNPKRHYRLYMMAKNLSEKGYFLNAVTLLDEAIGFYCFESFVGYGDAISKKIEKFIHSARSRAVNYELSNQSKMLVKQQEKFTGHFLIAEGGEKLTAGQKSSLQEKKRKIKEKIPASIFDKLSSLDLEMEFKRTTKRRDASLKNMILKELKGKPMLRRFVHYIQDTDNLRNNLAHGNSSDPVPEIRKKVDQLLIEFDRLCIQEDVLA